MKKIIFAFAVPCLLMASPALQSLQANNHSTVILKKDKGDKKKKKKACDGASKLNCPKEKKACCSKSAAVQ